MIKIHIGKNHIRVLGHAPRADDVPPGQNIVCAAVSALTLTLAEGLEGIARMDIDTRAEPGDARISWAESNSIGAALIDTWFLGITRIQESYAGSIEIM